MTAHRLPTIVRFMLHVTENPQSKCWEWTGYVDLKGYAKFRTGDRKVWAHRAAYELIVGPIPEGLYLDHLCRNHGCVNPRHLEPVTHAENVRRGERATATHCLRGHEYTSENTYIHVRPDGPRRVCRTCRRARGKKK